MTRNPLRNAPPTLRQRPTRVHLLPGTPVIRLFPGSVQIGCDPGKELILSGLNPTQEEWLHSITPQYVPAAIRYSPAPQARDIPPECAPIAHQLVISGYGCSSNTAGLRVCCERLEEPIVAAMESAMSSGLVASYTIADKRGSDYSSWGERSAAHGVSLVTAIRQHWEKLFPETSRPTTSSHDLHLLTLPLAEDGTTASAFFTTSTPRLMIYLGQNAAIVGPLLTSRSPICAYCCAHWIHDRRTGVAQRSRESALPLPRLNPCVSARVTLEVSDFIRSFAHYGRTGCLTPELEAWQQRFRHIGADGNVADEELAPHPACGCAAGLHQPFTPLAL